MLKKYPELKNSARDIFRDIIYSKKEADLEYEIVLLDDFIYKIEEQLYPQTLNDNEK